MVRHARVSFSRVGAGTAQFGKERVGIAAFAVAILFLASSNLLLESGVPQIQVVFHLVGIHDARHGNSVLLQDEVLPIDVNATGHLSQVDSRSGDRLQKLLSPTPNSRWVAAAAASKPSRNPRRASTV